ncbi:VOC family protein [Mesorhizobium sp. YC-39]|nr:MULTISPECIES: VOC family protein [unclassified Mesorhizobium]MCV3205594.1 VOC family protein [Mesorhizobium sp. YC-2]MCV3228007.1 VOC family protein [Mesorhizobium sp. YC-39]
MFKTGPLHQRLKEFSAEETGGLEFAGLGPNGTPGLWIVQGVPNEPRLHVAFRAESRPQVDAFYEAAIKAGGRDNGRPGLRPQYHPNYYGAYVLDPDGHNIEVVCHNATPD